MLTALVFGVPLFAQTPTPAARSGKPAAQALMMAQFLDLQAVTGQLKSKKKEVKKGSGWVSEKEMFKDSEGRIRKLRLAGGTAEWVLIEEFYYDEADRLRVIRHAYGSKMGESITQTVLLDGDRRILKVKYRRDFEREDLKLDIHEKKDLVVPDESRVLVDWVWNPKSEFKK